MGCMGVPQFDPHAGPPAYMYVRVANHLAAQIEAGDLAAGNRLPSEAPWPTPTRSRSAPSGRPSMNSAAVGS